MNSRILGLQGIDCRGTGLANLGWLSIACSFTEEQVIVNYRGCERSIELVDKIWL